MDKQQFFNGAVFDAWRWFGAHLGGGGAVFRTFAPNASRITLTGAMNGWTETDLHQDGRSGFWEVSVPGTQAGQTDSRAVEEVKPTPSTPTAAAITKWNSTMDEFNEEMIQNHSDKDKLLAENSPEHSPAQSELEL